MKQIGRFFKWYWLLNKRLLKKVSFLLILCAVPVLVIALNVVASRPAGIVTVALAQTDPDEEISSAAIERLRSGTTIINFIESGGPEAAADAVKYGEADAAWIFSAEVDTALAGLANDPSSGLLKPAVTIIEREDTVALKLAREKLAAAISPYLGSVSMREYTRSLTAKDGNFAALSGLSDADLQEFYDAAFGDDQVFKFVYAGSGEPLCSAYAAVNFLHIYSPYTLSPAASSRPRIKFIF